MEARNPFAHLYIWIRILVIAGLFVHDARLCLAQTTQERGRETFEEKCAECHTIGLGPVTGPDLNNVTGRRDEDWLIRFITEPGKMLSADPVAQKLLQDFDNYEMPNLGLGAEDAADIIAFIRDSSTASEAAIAMPPRTTLREIAKSGRWGLLVFFLVVAFTIVFVFASVAYSTNAPSEVNLQRALKLRKAIFFSLVTVLLIFLAVTIFDAPYFAGIRNPDRVVYLTMGQFRVAMSDGLVTSKKEWTQHLGKGITLKEGETVEFRITSVDVNHGAGFYDPNGQIVGQTQAMPGYVNRLSLKLDKPGIYTILCLEYCGPAHHAMKAAFKVE